MFSSQVGRALGFALIATGIVCPCAWPKVAYAAELGADETCPSRDAIAAAVESLLGKPALSADDLNLVQVGDWGDKYIIKVKGRVREYVDESRDCAKRARVAAVFVALTLAPPDIGMQDEQPPASPMPSVESSPKPVATVSTQPTPLVPVVPAEPVRGRLPGNNWGTGAEIGVRADMAPRSSRSVFDVGGQFQLIYASQTWGIVLGGYVPTSSTLQLENVRVQQARYAAFAGVRWLGRAHEIRWGIDACASVAMLRLRQLDAASANTVVRAEPALHLGASWSLDRRWLSPFAGLVAELVPVAVPIAVEPRGVVGHSSAVWLGLAAGVALGTY